MIPMGHELFVEGRDDMFAVLHLMRSFHPEIDIDVEQPHAVQRKPALVTIRTAKKLPRQGRTIDEGSSVQTLLDVIEKAIGDASGERIVGFVLDADDSLESRWKQVCDRLARVGVEVGREDRMRPPQTGFIGTSTSKKTRTGVWIMPDNRSPGALEDFLRELIAEDDALIGHAQSATAQARAIDQRFRDVDLRKAELSAWLAWQEVPGNPYGTAIKARWFRHDRPSGVAFATWFCELYELPAPMVASPA